MNMKSMRIRRLGVMLAIAIMTACHCAIPVEAACNVQMQELVSAPAGYVQPDVTYTATDVDAPVNYEEPVLGPAICMDEFGNIITAYSDGFSYIIALGPVFSTNEDGNIIDEHGDIVAYAPFMVGKMAEDGAITLVDNRGVAVAFHLENGLARFDYALAPAAYMDEFGRVVLVDYFGRETFLTSSLTNEEVN